MKRFSLVAIAAAAVVGSGLVHAGERSTEVLIPSDEFLNIVESAAQLNALPGHCGYSVENVGETKVLAVTPDGDVSQTLPLTSFMAWRWESENETDVVAIEEVPLAIGNKRVNWVLRRTGQSTQFDYFHAYYDKAVYADPADPQSGHLVWTLSNPILTCYN